MSYVKLSSLRKTQIITLSFALSSSRRLANQQQSRRGSGQIRMRCGELYWNGALKGHQFVCESASRATHIFAPTRGLE